MTFQAVAHRRHSYVSHHVRVPTVLIVGENDIQVIQLNRAALKQLRCETQLAIVLEATHLFEERGAVDEVARVGPRVVPPPSAHRGTARYWSQQITRTNAVLRCGSVSHLILRKIMKAALDAVVCNKGAPGVDGIPDVRMQRT